MTMLTPEQEALWPLARAGYERYSSASMGRSQVSGDKLPAWDDLPAGIKNAWWAVADAITSRTTR